MQRPMSACRLFLLFFLFSLVCGGARRWKKLGLRSPPLPPGTAVAEAQWFKDQKLDHFTPSDTNTWEQRYFVNDTLWDRQNGPVFLMLGGEGPANPAWLAVNTEIMINAARFKAIVILLEHRFDVCVCNMLLIHWLTHLCVCWCVGIMERATPQRMPLFST